MVKIKICGMMQDVDCDFLNELRVIAGNAEPFSRLPSDSPSAASEFAADCDDSVVYCLHGCGHLCHLSTLAKTSGATFQRPVDGGGKTAGTNQSTKAGGNAER